MELLKAPPPLQLTGNLSKQWKRFKQKFDLFLVATTTKEQPRSEAAKAALLLSVAGDDALDVFNTFTFEARESQEDYATVVEKLESYCSEVCTDNGPQFSSYEFAEFARKYDFSHVTSSPHYPQSNGLAEKGVQIVKRLLKKSQDSGEDFWLGLLAYRSTPLEDGRSPGELLQGRRLRSNVPDFGDVQSMAVKKHRQASSGKPLSPLEKGSLVRLRNATWSPKGTVVRTTSPRSYEVETEDGRVFRRNRRHLLQTREQCSEGASDDYDYGSPDRTSGDPSAPASSSAVGVTVPTPSQQHPSSVDGANPPRTTQPVLATPPRPTQAPRRSGRAVKPPERLRYDENFNQLT